MELLLDILSLPFMQRALAAGVVLGVTLACLGVIATLRNMSFFGEGVAHASLAGIAIGLLAGVSPLPIALIWAVAIAILIYFLEKSTLLSSDSLIGIFFTASMALGIVIMYTIPGYQPELMSFLFGSILAIRPVDLIVIFACSIPIIFWFLVSKKDLTYASLNEDSAIVSGAPVAVQTLIFYVALAITIVLGVKMLGIILVSALLILPAASSRLISTSFRTYLTNSVVIAEMSIVLGLLFSVILDIPSGATIVLTGTIIFLLAALLRVK